MSAGLTVLCITKNEPYAQPFLARLARDARTIGADLHVEIDGAGIQSDGYIESVLDEAIGRVTDGYVLRIDDDETISLRMLEWLRRREYEQADHWAFPRANLWPTAARFISNEPLWPDLQTRLSIKAKAGGRTGVHDGSPFGTGQVAPCHIEHHKFLVRSREEREALVRSYDLARPGAGSEFVMFSVPELYEDDLRCDELT